MGSSGGRVHARGLETGSPPLIQQLFAAVTDLSVEPAHRWAAPLAVA